MPWLSVSTGVLESVHARDKGSSIEQDLSALVDENRMPGIVLPVSWTTEALPRGSHPSNSPGQTAQATLRALHVGTLVTMPRMLLRHTNRQIKTVSPERWLSRYRHATESSRRKKLRLLKVVL